MEKLNAEKYKNKETAHGFRKAFIKDEQIPLEARFLLILLMTYLGKNSNCWPSQGELAKRMGRNRDTVRKYLRVLQKNGYLKINYRGIGRSLLYAPSYLKIYAGGVKKEEDTPKPAEIPAQRPAETLPDRSIISGNKDSGYGKKLFDKRRKELGLISKKGWV